MKKTVFEDKKKKVKNIAEEVKAYIAKTQGFVLLFIQWRQGRCTIWEGTEAECKAMLDTLIMDGTMTEKDDVEYLMNGRNYVVPTKISLFL